MDPALPDLQIADVVMPTAGRDKDKWTTVTADGKLSAHYENTVLITDGEPEILTVAEGL